MTFLCDNPWIFHRDEIDLLEEEMDDIYRAHRPSAHDPVSQMEDRVLKEQLQTEEQFETDVTIDVEPEEVRPPHDFFSGSLPDSLKAQSARDPLYEVVYLWAKRAYAYAAEKYLSQQFKDEDVFRIYVNVNMIPLKLASALFEQMADDPVSQHIAQKEQQLCFTYLTRTLDSLQHRAFLGDEEAVRLEKEGRELERSIRLHLV